MVAASKKSARLKNSREVRTGIENKGSKPGERRGGRQKGTKNKRTKFREELVCKILVSGKDPLTFLLNIYKNEQLPLDYRMKAASEALPYVHQRKPVALEHSGPGGQPIPTKCEIVFIGAPISVPGLTDQERDAALPPIDVIPSAPEQIS